MSSLTSNQKAILEAVKSGGKRLIPTTAGWALWDRDIWWSQGRTLANAVSKEDQKALEVAGFVQYPAVCASGAIPPIIALEALEVASNEKCCY